MATATAEVRPDGLCLVSVPPKALRSIPDDLLAVMPLSGPARNLFLVHWTDLPQVKHALGVVRFVDAKSRDLFHRIAEDERNLLRARRACLLASRSFERCVSGRFSPRHYQEQAAMLAGGVERLLLADSVGLGKTMSAWLVRCSLMEQKKDVRTVILCAGGLRLQWASEIHDYTDGKVKALVARTWKKAGVKKAGVKKRRHLYARFIKEPRSVLILSYALLQKEAHRLDPVFAAADYVIADEASRLKNRRTKTASALKALCRGKRARWRAALSATPVELSPENVFSIMEWLDKRRLGTLSSFRALYVRETYLAGGLVEEDGKRRWKVEEMSGPEFFKERHKRRLKIVKRKVEYLNLDHLRARIEPRYLRRTPEDVGEQMPEVSASVRWVDLGKAQRECYERAKAGDAKRGEKAWSNPLVAAGASIRACLSPALLGGKGPGAKTEELLWLLTEEAPDERAVVFCESRRYLVEEVRPALEKVGVTTGLIAGGVSGGKREKVKRDFAAGKIRVVLATAAGEEGLNLPCGLAVDLDLTWNPKRLKQRVGRACRMESGIDRVRVLNILARGTVEERVLKVVLGRKTLSEALMGKDAMEVVGALPRGKEARGLL